MTEIGSSQPRHFPRKAIQLNIGTLSYHAIDSRTAGSASAVATRSSRGQRTMHTLRNDPMHAPMTNA